MMEDGEKENKYMHKSERQRERESEKKKMNETRDR
jgi:hypothetical protein